MECPVNAADHSFTLQGTHGTWDDKRVSCEQPGGTNLLSTRLDGVASLIFVLLHTKPFCKLCHLSGEK